MFTLGTKAKDNITGFEGIITASIQYIHGDTQYFLEAPVKDGKAENAWIVEDRLEAVEE